MTERLFRESYLALPKTIYASHAAKQKCKHVREINKSKETTDLHNISGSRSRTLAQATDTLKKRKFCKNSYQRDKCPTYGKVCHN